jgi:hypothetical protein
MAEVLITEFTEGGCMPKNKTDVISEYENKAASAIAEELRRAKIDAQPTIDAIKKLVAKKLGGHYRRDHHSEFDKTELTPFPWCARPVPGAPTSYLQAA